MRSLPAAAELARRRALHAVAKTVRHEPRGLVGHAKHALKLLGRNALLGRADQVIRIDPLVQRNLGVLKHGADSHGVLLGAVSAGQKAGADALRQIGLMAVLTIRAAAVGAYRAFGPADVLKVGPGGGLVGKAGLGVTGGASGLVFGVLAHGLISL